jgi:hypothetical protein
VNGPADRGRRRRLASKTISDFAFGFPLFFYFVFEFNLLFKSFSFFFLFFFYCDERTTLHFVHN